MDLTPVRDIAFSSTTFWVAFGVACLIWMLIAAILVYHWKNYGAGDPKIRRMRLAYFIGSALLLASAASFIFSIA